MERKEELIKLINDARVELGLQPYPSEYLEEKDLVYLENLWHQWFEMREERRRKLEESKKFKLNVKIGLLILIPVLIVTSFFIFSFLTKPQAVNPSSLPSLGPSEVGNKTYTSTFLVETTFKGPEDNYMLVIKNSGIENITFSRITIDEQDANFEIFSGSYPIPPQTSTYIKIFRKCDASVHTIELTDDKGSSLKSTLEPC
jgi:hypothetical protein